MSIEVVGHIDEVIPVDVYVPDCPPRPEAIIDGITRLLDKLKSAKSDSRLPSREGT